MNIVLFVLIVLASTLVASSSNMMYSTTVAVDSFIKTSQVADLSVSIADTAENTKEMEEWASSVLEIDAYYSESQIHIPSNHIKVLDGDKSISGRSIVLLSTIPQSANFIFGQNNERFTLQEGEIGLPVNFKHTLGVELGDEITIDINGSSKTFTVKDFFKDALMGSELIALKRPMISQPDYDEMRQWASEESVVKLWSFVKDSGEDKVNVMTEFSKSNILSQFDIDKSFVELTFMTDRILSVILFIVSLFLIFIAFLTLKFTIVSTLQDDYREIGVMKAIGFTNGGIRKLYLTKYLGLSVIGGVIGFFINLPLTQVISRSMSEYIMVPTGNTGVIISIFSTVAIVAIILLFCYMCMRKINRASPIDAIRQGHNGERFTSSWKMSLHKRKSLPTTLFLAIGDVVNRLKGYTTLIFTFVLSTVVILIPINLSNTILDDAFIGYLGVTPADFYLEIESGDSQVAQILSKVDSLEQQFEKEHFDVTLAVDYTINTKYIPDDGGDGQRIMGSKSTINADQYDYLDGLAPRLDNEIAITKLMAERYEKGIGDSIVFEVDDQKQTFLITGTYQTISNGGDMVRLPDAYDPDHVAGYLISGNINASADEKPHIISDMKDKLTDLNVKSAADMMADVTGGFINQLKMIIGLIIAVVSLIIFFITSLFVRLLITKEVRGIAIMKSLGFTNGQVKVWQSLRILILLIGSIIIGVFSANLLGGKLVGMLFRLFGLTDLNIVISPLQVYLLCPLLIIIVVSLAVYTSCGQIKRIHVWNMNEE